MSMRPDANGGELIFVDKALWARLGSARSAQEFSEAWLALQCSMIAGVECAVVVIRDADRPGFEPVAVWPTRDALQPSVTGLAEDALNHAEPQVVQDATTLTVAYPLVVAGEAVGVVAVGVNRRSDADTVLRQLQWGSIWIDTYLRKSESGDERRVAQQLMTVLDLIATSLSHERFADAARAVVTEMAVLLDCDRVSLGFLKSGFADIVAMSHSSGVGGHMNLVRSIANAMDEAIDQHTTIVLPEPTGAEYCVTREHEHLSGLVGGAAVMSIPLRTAAGPCGALTLERSGASGFDDSAVRLCQAVAVAVGPMLEIKRLEDRSIFAKMVSAGRRSVGRIVGPGHIALKLIAIAATLTIAFVTFVDGEYRVTANGHVEGAERRVVTAPVDGYVSRAGARAGDTVRAGDILFEFDDRDLRLERVQVSSERAQLGAQLQDAMARRERADLQIISAQIEQADAHLALLDEQIQRMRVVAPFDGYVVSGDLSQSLGAAVERGAVLFELAPLRRYRVILEVDEHDIADVVEGQAGTLVLAALPQDRLQISVTRLTSVASTSEGVNYFRVEADLLSDSERVRPGMEGVGKVDVDERPLIGVWTHQLVRWLRLQLWAWSP